MIVDSSAILSIVFREKRSERLLQKLVSADAVGIGTPTLTETSIVIRAQLGVAPEPILDAFVRDFQVTIVDFLEVHWREASVAYSRFGKGRHPAALNFGDCMSYAVAVVADAPLLYVGNDFNKTDIAAA